MTANASPHVIPERWGLMDVLIGHPGLDLVPGGGNEVVLAGDLRFAAEGPDTPRIDDSYILEIRIPRTYPSRGFPRVFERGGRIPSDYHHLTDGSLCLGAQTRLRLIALTTPRIGAVIEQAVIPYLYSRSFYERFGRMPFGELAHGNAGLSRDLIAQLHMPGGTRADQLLEALAARRREANKRTCPCGSGRRLGQCHNGVVNAARVAFGRVWFDLQAAQILGRGPRKRRRGRY